jgi:hypothetical protein
MEDNSKEITIKSQKKAERAQRAAMYTLLAGDIEYGNLTEYVSVPEDVGEALAAEIKGTMNIKVASDKNIMQLVMYDIQGYSAALVAKQMGITEGQVHYIKSTDGFANAKQAALDAVLDTARKFMQVSTVKAVKTLVDCMNSSSEKIRLQASIDVLNRSGLSAPTQIELFTHQNGLGNLSEEDLQEIVKKELPFGKNVEVIEIGAEHIK